MLAVRQQEIDWQYLFRSAARHRVVPILYQQLAALEGGAVPDAVLDSLRAEFQRNAWRSMALTREMLDLLTALEAVGIPAVPVKGPLLASLLYGSVALRQFTDLDLLIRRRDVLRAKGALLDRGYRQPYPLTAAQEMHHLRFHREYGLVRSDGRILLELQWELAEGYFSFPLTLDSLWERLEPASLAGKPVLSLATEDLLLMLCAHGAKHVWHRLAWICDVARLLEVQPDIDWDRVLRQARDLGSEWMLFLGLSLASELLGARLAPEIARKVHGRRIIVSLASQVSRNLFEPESEDPGLLRSCVFHLRSRERWRDRVGYCFRLATTPTLSDYGLFSLPPGLASFYYVVRPVRMAGTYAQKVFPTRS
jgi:hypothetical protein